MPGGENQLVKAQLPHVYLDKSEMSECLDEFLNGHRNYFQKLSRADDPVIPGILIRGRAIGAAGINKQAVIDSLKLLHPMVQANAKWYQEDDVVNLCGSLFSLRNRNLTQADIQAYSTYARHCIRSFLYQA